MSLGCSYLKLEQVISRDRISAVSGSRFLTIFGRPSDGGLVGGLMKTTVHSNRHAPAFGFLGEFQPNNSSCPALCVKTSTPSFVARTSTGKKKGNKGSIQVYQRLRSVPRWTQSQWLRRMATRPRLRRGWSRRLLPRMSGKEGSRVNHLLRTGAAA